MCSVSSGRVFSAQNLVTSERLVNALKEPENWLTYWGDYSGIRHRELKQINTSNVKDLRLEWMFQTGVAGAFQAVPLVVNGVMYFSGGEGRPLPLMPRPAGNFGAISILFPKRRTDSSTAR